MYVWPCAVVLGQYVWYHRDEVKGQHVIEVRRNLIFNTDYTGSKWEIYWNVHNLFVHQLLGVYL